MTTRSDSPPVGDREENPLRRSYSYDPETAEEGRCVQGDGERGYGRTPANAGRGYRVCAAGEDGRRCCVHEYGLQQDGERGYGREHGERQGQDGELWCGQEYIQKDGGRRYRVSCVHVILMVLFLSNTAWLAILTARYNNHRDKTRESPIPEKLAGKEPLQQTDFPGTTQRQVDTEQQPRDPGPGLDTRQPKDPALVAYLNPPSYSTLCPPIPGLYRPHRGFCLLGSWDFWDHKTAFSRGDISLTEDNSVIVIPEKGIYELDVRVSFLSPSTPPEIKSGPSPPAGILSRYETRLVLWGAGHGTRRFSGFRIRPSDVGWAYCTGLDPLSICYQSNIRERLELETGTRVGVEVRAELWSQIADREDRPRIAVHIIRNA